MKIAIVMAAAVVAVFSLPLTAQQANSSAQQSVQTSPGNGSASESSSLAASANRNGVNAQNSGSASAPMTSINGELANKLDSKSAHVGDPVIVKTTEKARTADGVEIPKGSRLVGRVTSVHAHGSGNENSSLGVAFDRAELHNGQTMPIHSVIQSITPAPSIAASSAANGNDDMALSGGGMRGGGGGTARGGGGLGGGGLVGGATGAVGNTVHTVGSTAGAAGSAVTSTTGSVANSTVSAAGNTAGNVAATTGSAVHGTAQGAGQAAGSLAAQATGIPGVMLAGDASGATSGTLTAARKNVHLDSGTQVMLGISSAVNRQ